MPTRPLVTAAPSHCRRSSSPPTVRVLAMASALSAGCASASFRTPLTGTDRPGYTFGTATVPLGGAQAELGYTDTRVASLTYQTLGEGLLRIGAGPNTEVRVFGNSYALRSDGGSRADGMEDAKLGLKQRLYAGKGTRGLAGASLALLPALSLPTGSTSFGADAWQPELLIAGALPLSPVVSLVANVGDAYVRLGDEHTHRMLATLAAWYTLSPKLSAFGEYGGSQLSSARDTRMHYFDAGFAVVPVPAIQLDLRVGSGANGIDNDRYVGVGVTRRF